MRESQAPDLAEIADKVVDAVSFGEGFDWKDYFSEVIDVEDKTEVALLWHQMRRMVSALRALLGSMDPELAEMLREQGAVSFGDVTIYAKRKRSEVVIDTTGFEQWLEANPKLAARLFNPNSVRFGQLPKAARETFFEVVWEDKIGVEEVSKEFMR